MTALGSAGRRESSGRDTAGQPDRECRPSDDPVHLALEILHDLSAPSRPLLGGGDPASVPQPERFGQNGEGLASASS
jgi:hypothetical protein